MSLRSLRRFNCADVAPRSASGHLLRAAQITIESWQRHYNTAARLTRIQAASTGGVHACIRRVAGCATPTGSAGHAGATTNLKSNRFRPLGKLVVGNLDRIADVDDLGN